MNDIYKLRKKCGLSQVQAAAVCLITEKTFLKYENNEAATKPIYRAGVLSMLENYFKNIVD